jgi:hypothetical protein
VPVEGHFENDPGMVNNRAPGAFRHVAAVDLHDTGSTVSLQVKPAPNAPGRPLEGKRWVTVENDDTVPTLLKADPIRPHVLIPA